jgi:hypothetical protein
MAKVSLESRICMEHNANINAKSKVYLLEQINKVKHANAQFGNQAFKINYLPLFIGPHGLTFP